MSANPKTVCVPCRGRPEEWAETDGQGHGAGVGRAADLPRLRA